jgi:hypothetical protein
MIICVNIRTFEGFQAVEEVHFAGVAVARKEVPYRDGIRHHMLIHEW